MLSAYARFIVRRSYVVLFVVIAISTVLTVIPLVYHDLPSFSDPIVGFETRGTTLAGRFIAWENLIDETRPSRSLAVNPQEIADQARMNRTYQQNVIGRSRSALGRSQKKERNKNKKTNSTIDEIAKIGSERTSVFDGNITNQTSVLDGNITNTNPQRNEKKNTKSTVTEIAKIWQEPTSIPDFNLTNTDSRRNNKKKTNIAEIAKLWPERTSVPDRNITTSNSQRNNRKKTKTAITEIAKLSPERDRNLTNSYSHRYNKKKTNSTTDDIAKLGPERISISDRNLTNTNSQRNNKKKHHTAIAEIAKLWPDQTSIPGRNLTNTNSQGNSRKKTKTAIAEIAKLWPQRTSILDRNLTNTTSQGNNRKKTKTAIAEIAKLWPERTSIPDRNLTNTNSQGNNKKKTKTAIAEIEKLWPEQPSVPDGYTPDTDTHSHWGFGINKSFEDEESFFRKDHTRKQWKYLKNLQRRPTKPIQHNYASAACGAPVLDFAHLVVTTRDNTSMLTYSNVRKLCDMQLWLLQTGGSDYFYMCQRSTRSEEICCPIWSVPNYIALISGKDSCDNITREDVSRAVTILKKCAGYFHNFSLMASCEMNSCRVPNYCTQYDAIYNMFFYLIDAKAFSPLQTDNDFVTDVMLFLPLPASSTVLPYYKKLRSSNLSYDTLFIPAMDFGLKNTIFDLCVIRDTWLIALGGLFVFLSVWIYTKSLLLTLLLFIAITYSLGIAYFLYVYVYRLDFFPFMNLLVIVVVIGIGADDAFLFVKVWNMVRKQLMQDNVANRDNEVSDIRNVSNAGETLLIQILQETLKHSVVAILVTSLTTAVAFFASYVSHIPAINCFSVFAGTAVLVNFFLMVSWLPVSVFLVDVKLCKSKWNLSGLSYNAVYAVLKDIKGAFNTFIVTCVAKLHIILFLVLGGVGIASIIVVFHKPGLRLPDSRQFQLFQKSHPFEQYDMVYRDNFLFERFGKDIGVGSNMPLRWVWGVQPVDNGNHMDPGSTGHLVLDKNFTISELASQKWLLEFCGRIKAQPFYQTTLGPLLPNCFIESFKVFMSRRCLDYIGRINRAPCCETSLFPYKKEVFDFCIIKAMESLYMTPRELFMPGVAGPKFLRSATPPKVAVVVVEFESVVPYSMSYTAMNEFFLEVENWTHHEMSLAPPGMSRGWFLSDLQFYDLQLTLARGTVQALLLSAGLGFLVLVPATMSFVVSMCALLAMIFSSTVTIAILVLSNWKLNVLESVAISTSAGLAVDFSLHYALSYTNSNGPKSARVKYALSASTGPTFAAAITTGFAGIFLIRSSLLPYSQIGTFLALIMSVSWIYSTFFLCSLLYIFGRSVTKDVPVEGPAPASRVSSICSGVPHTESHELENLAESSRTNITYSHSPSCLSATTVVLHDDYDHHAHRHNRSETMPSLSNYLTRDYD